MSPKRVRIIAMALAVLVALAVVAGLVSLAIPPARAEESLETLRGQAQALAEEKKRIQEELDQLAQDKATLTRHKRALDKQIEITIAEIENTSGLIIRLTAEIAGRQAALDQALREEAQQLEDFLVRIRLMEEAGEAQYLGVLLQADSFSDLLGRLSAVQDIMDYDRKLLAQLKAAREKVDAEKKALERDRVEQDQYNIELAERQNELESQNAEQQRLIRELESQEAELRKAEDERERQEELIQEEIRKEIRRLEEERRLQHQSTEYVGGDFLWPVPSYSRITSEFGMRYHPILKENRGHKGTDIAASSGSAILAANAGTVIKADYNPGGYGNYVVIDHGGGQATLYGHMSRILVSSGDYVARGDTIGLVGSTGLSTGPHLHFEVILNGGNVDPMQFFR